MTAEYCVINKTLKAGTSIYVKGGILYPPYPKEIQNELDAKSPHLKVVLTEERESKIFDDPVSEKVMKPKKEKKIVKKVKK